MTDSRRPSLFDLPFEAPETERPETAQGKLGSRAAPPAPRRDRAPALHEPELPLFAEVDEEEPRQPERVSERASERGPELGEGDLFDHLEDRTDDTSPRDSGPLVAESPAPASLGRRWRAGGLDLLVHAVLALLLIAGARLLGARPLGPETSGVAVFLVVFSFLYTVIPLAFWGQTPGMTKVGLAAHTGDQSALTFGQTALRWLGGVLTLLLFGLPSLLVLWSERSFTDRLSGSRTVQTRG